MNRNQTKVVVAMSGGVDSSVATCLLHEQGYDVLGLFMRVGVDAPELTEHGGRSHQGCCSASDAGDARFVAGMLGIPFYALNFENEFNALIDYFADEYVNGRTPNPCVVCNQRFKFGRILDYADAVGADFVATGHYARIDETEGGRRVLRKAVDSQKDQSYVLFNLSRQALNRAMFPLGHMTKEQVRREARRFGLPNCDKPDSVEICFVPDRDYARVVQQRRPEAFAKGEVVDQTGRVIGRHNGIGHFTIGQRRGLGIAAGVPIYVTQIDADSSTVTVGDKESLMKRGLEARRVNLFTDVADAFRADVKIRYLHRPAPAVVEVDDDGNARVVFDEPQAAITPGQAVVFYQGDGVVGGGWIERGFDF